MIIKTKSTPGIATWLAAIAAAVAFFLLCSWMDRGDVDALSSEELTDEARIDAEMQARADGELLLEVSRIAREAHAQGMREALASVNGTERGEVFERSCARLWAGQQP